MNLQLIDINNHVPTFNQMMYNATLLANLLPNTLLSFNTGIMISDLDMVLSAVFRFYITWFQILQQMIGYLPMWPHECGYEVVVYTCSPVYMTHTKMVKYQKNSVFRAAIGKQGSLWS